MQYLKRALFPLLLAGVLSCVALSADDGDKGKDPTVYVTKTGSKYHGAGCSYLRRSRIAKSLTAAKASGHSACSRCGGP